MEESGSPLALQLAVRVEKTDPPTTAAVCRAVVAATVDLLDDPRSRPDGEWHDEVAAWNGARIRKLVRRARGAAWERAQDERGLTASVDGVEVRAFVPGPLDDAPEAVRKLQIQSTPLADPEPIVELPARLAGLVIAVTPEVEMSWGKQAAQCAHAGHRWWMSAVADRRRDWDEAGRPISILHPDPRLWAELDVRAEVRVHDGGFTEIPAGTLTTVAWWADPPPHREDVLLGGPNEQRLGLARAVRVGDLIVVGGTAPIAEDGSNVDPADVEAQARRCYEIVGAALRKAGAGPEHVVRTRTLLVDIADYEVVAGVRKQFLASAMPVDTIVEVSRFVDPDWKLEIEVDAVV